jgi:hypothetical protein
MPEFRVTVLEKFLVTTIYVVTAANSDEAERLCKEGEASYEQVRIEEGDDEWVETLSVEPD